MRVLIIFANEMKKVLTLVMLLVLAMTGMAQNKVKDMQTVYDFSLKDKKGNDVSLEQYKGKVLLIVNTATGCGFTPQYEDLEAMYHRLKDKGLEILDVPCNQFGHQAPGTDEEIKQFCTLKFGADFPQFKKSDVNGANELPLYTWLKSQKPCQGGYEAKLAAVMEKLYNEANPEPRKKDDIQWNFTKFLISRDGQVIARFEPTVDMKEVEKQTEAAL
jgi:glutathione peroxidase